MDWDSQTSQVEPFTDWEDLNAGDRNAMSSFVSVVERFSINELQNDVTEEQCQSPDRNEEDGAMQGIAREPSNNWEDLDPNDPDAMHSTLESAAGEDEAMPDLAFEISKSHHQVSFLEDDSHVKELCGVWIMEDDKPSSPLREVALGWTSPRVEAPRPDPNITASTAIRTALPQKGTEEYFQLFAQPEDYPEATQIFDVESRDGKMQFRNPFNQPDSNFFGEWEFGSEGESPGRRRSSSSYEVPPQGLRREMRMIQDFPRPLKVQKGNSLLKEEIVRNSSRQVVGARRILTGFDHIPWENETGNRAVKKGKKWVCKNKLCGWIRRQSSRLSR